MSVFLPSSETVRGKAMDLVSASELRKERTAETPSALRKAVVGLKPLAVLSEMPPAWAVLPRVVVTKLLLLLTMVDEGTASARVEVRPPGAVAVVVVAAPVPLPVWVVLGDGSAGQAVSESHMLGGSGSGPINALGRADVLGGFDDLGFDQDLARRAVELAD